MAATALHAVSCFVGFVLHLPKSKFAGGGGGGSGGMLCFTVETLVASKIFHASQFLCAVPKSMPMEVPILIFVARNTRCMRPSAIG